MQQSTLITDRPKYLPTLLIALGAGIIGVSFAYGLIGAGQQTGIGANLISVVFSGFAVLISGMVMVVSADRRQIGEWLLVLMGVIAVSLAADVLIIGSLPGLSLKVLMLATITLALVLSGVIPAPSLSRWRVGELLKHIRSEGVTVAQFLSIVLQLGLLVLVIRQFQIENQAFYNNIMLITFYGFIIHHFLPLRYRLPFFLFLSIAAIFGLFGASAGFWFVGIGMGLIGICNLPWSLRTRVVILVIFGVALALFRAEIFPAPMPSLIWPILGSMFMFRLFIYLYDIEHQKEPPGFWHSLAYFFQLPNLVFPLYPVIDFSVQKRTYFDKDQFKIYQTGINWMFRGIVQLIAYRYVNYYLVISPESVTNIGELVQYLIPNLLLLVRVTGQFHLIIGLLHLFGFNLPEINFRYFLASSFTDFWRRANIYWKDFMVKVFYYPSYFKMRMFSTTTRLVLATLFAFFMTWLLHSYQWFWLRGSFLFTIPDLLFWAILGLLVLINSLYETKFGRKRSLKKEAWSARATAFLSLRTLGIFSTILILWSLWTSTSVAEWFSLWSVIGKPIENISNFYPLVLVIAVLVGASYWYSWMDSRESQPISEVAGFFRTAMETGSYILIVFLIGSPFVYTRLPEKPQAVIADLRTIRLSDVEAGLLLRGYYENLTSVNQFNSELWDVYSKRPTEWPLIQETDLAAFTGDFRVLSLVPSKSLVFHGGTFTTNRWGIRDQDYEMTPPPGTYRMAIVGPSFVMGSGVNDNEVFESLVEERLNTETEGGKYSKYEILNFSMAGYSALQELYELDTRISSFEPEAILFVGHQLEEEIIVRNLAQIGLSGGEIPYDYLREVLNDAGVNEVTSQSEAERNLKPFGPDLVEWTYNTFAEISRNNGILPVWVYLPTLEVSSGEEIKTELAILAEAAGFITLDLSDVYDGYDKSTLEVAEWDKHPNAQAQKLIADRLYESLRQYQDQIPLEVPAWK